MSILPAVAAACAIAALPGSETEEVGILVLSDVPMERILTCKEKGCTLITREEMNTFFDKARKIGQSEGMQRRCEKGVL